MKWKLLFLAVTLLVLSSCAAAQKKSKRWVWPDSIDIDTKADDTELDPGSGDRRFDTDDEDLINNVEGSTGEEDIEDVISGSGGDPILDPDEVDYPILTPPLTACQRLRTASRKNVPEDSYIPTCTDTGDFNKLQCNRRHQSGHCWCVTPKGTEIAGTRMDRPNTPDCVSGANLKRCSFQLLKSHYKIIGVIRPRCTINGEYEPIQSFKGEYWCVDEQGIEKENTRRLSTDIKCDETTTESVAPTTVRPTTKSPKPETKTEDVVDPTDGIIIDRFDDAFTPAPEEEKTEKPDVPFDHTLKYPKTDSPDNDNRPGDYDTKKGDLTDTETTTFKQFVNRPFILGAIIAGAVVGLLGAILLVMFIVYRMRKKDEGSYALEEEKFTNYSYMKAPDKEFYA